MKGKKGRKDKKIRIFIQRIQYPNKGSFITNKLGARREIILKNKTRKFSKSENNKSRD